MPPWASCRLSATGIRFLGILSRQGIPLSSRSAYQAAPGPWRGFHVPHIRVTAGLGALFTPRPSGALTAGPIPPAAARPLFQGPGPITPACFPSPGAVYYEASSRVHSRSPARPSPWPVGPWMEQRPLGPAPRASHPCRQDLRRTPGGGRASSTRPELYARHNRTSFPQAHSQCATSCRTIGTDMSRFPTPGHLVSWARLAPGIRESAAAARPPPPARGTPGWRHRLGEAATSAARTNTFLGAPLQADRPAPRQATRPASPSATPF